jgi:hypothetical protein
MPIGIKLAKKGLGLLGKKRKASKIKKLRIKAAAVIAGGTVGAVGAGAAGSYMSSKAQRKK